MPSLRPLGRKIHTIFSLTRRHQDKQLDTPNRNPCPPRFIIDIPQKTSDGANLPTMTSFPQFPRLPLELRQLVWFFAVDDIGPRVLPISIVREENNMSFQTRSCVSFEDWLFKCPVPPPVLLQVCQESRTLAKTRYTQSFIIYSCCPKRYAWVDVDRDIVDLGTHTVNFVFMDAVLGKIKTLRLYESSERGLRASIDCMEDRYDYMRGAYKNLREIEVVCLEGVQAWTGVDYTCRGPDRLERVWLLDKDTGDRTPYDLSWIQPPETEPSFDLAANSTLGLD